MKEHEYRDTPPPLPDEVLDVFRGADYAAVPMLSEMGTLYVVKAPAADIAQVPAACPISLDTQMWQLPTAIVLRQLLAVHDSDRPLAFEVFLSPREAYDREVLREIAERECFYINFYDERHHFQRGKQVPAPNAAAIRALVGTAWIMDQDIPDDRFDFALARDAIMSWAAL